MAWFTALVPLLFATCAGVQLPGEIMGVPQCFPGSEKAVGRVQTLMKRAM